MQDNSSDENQEDINNPEDQKETILINSQEKLVEHLKNAHDHEGVYMHVNFGISKYLIYNGNNDGTIIEVKLLDMLCDGVIAPNAITNLDEILQYKDAIIYPNNFLRFLYWFYEREFSKQIGYFELVRREPLGPYASETELKNAVSAFDAQLLRQKPTKYIIDLAKQKNSLNKENYTQEDPLENYLMENSIEDISDLKNLLNKGQKIPWSKLAPALRDDSIKELSTLKEVATFDENNKINGSQVRLFSDKSVGNWQELFEICDNGAKHEFIFYQYTGFKSFKDGAFKGFDLNDTQTLKEYGLIKQSRFMYLPYVLWDIGRIIVWAISFGKCCKDDAWFEKTAALYEGNSDIEEAIQRIKENQEKEPVSEPPKEKEIKEDKNQNNVEIINGFKPKISGDKNISGDFKNIEEGEDMK